MVSLVVVVLDTENNRICFLCLTESNLSESRVVCRDKSQSRCEPKLGCYSRPSKRDKLMEVIQRVIDYILVPVPSNKH